MGTYIALKDVEKVDVGLRQACDDSSSDRLFVTGEFSVEKLLASRDWEHRRIVCIFDLMASKIE